MSLDQLVESLLYEGYALYPYTPGATKNATPTPFGIVYPPAYAEANPSCFDRLRMECVLEGEGELSAEVRFLQAAGERHEGVERRVELDEPGLREFEFDHLRGPRAAAAGGTRRGLMCVHNSTPFSRRRPRRGAAQLVRRHPCGGARLRRPLPLLLDHAGRAGQLLSWCRDDGRRRGAGRGDRPSRPSSDRRREPRQPVRRHRDRGGAAACTFRRSATRSGGRSSTRTRPSGR